MQLSYKWWTGASIPDNVLSSCATLFGDHYGVWSDRGVHPGRRIRLNPQRLRDFLPTEDSLAVTAWDTQVDQPVLVGYAFAIRVRDEKYRTITWVSQLVVHTDYQNRGIAKTILGSVWGFSDHYAWGIASANPYAIRALEKATKRRCDPKMIEDQAKSLLAALGGRIPYLVTAVPDFSNGRSVIDTQFHQDHSLAFKRLADVNRSTDGTAWQLGRINPGEEWLGVTFNSQKPLRWTDKELGDFMSAASQIVNDAYDRMAGSRAVKEHSWAKFTTAEVAFLIAESGMPPGVTVVDFGCGNGRHALEMAAHGYLVTGVDFSQAAVYAARARAENGGARACAEFIKDDCRTVELGRQFDMGICLYDVVGSFPDDDDNLRILRNFARHIKTGGFVALSVMSYPYIRTKAKIKADIISDSRPLEMLRAGRIMQETGDVFDPDYFVLDNNKRVVYRKEQFDVGTALPTELIVRDRRYGIKELKDMCSKVGIHVLKVGHVSAGNFETVGQTNKLKKEILVLGRKATLV